jgi:hypothetical protein
MPDVTINMRIKTYIFIVLLLVTIISCTKRKKITPGEYRVQSFFSKASDAVSSSAFPVILIYPDHHFEMITNGKQTSNGKLVFYDDGFDFKTEKGTLLRAFYTANDSLIQFRNIIALNIEAKTAEYILTKTDF